MTRLIVFDIDGTLLQTSRVDEECFVRSMEEAFGLGNIDTDWGAYLHATDRWIVGAIIRERLGREPSEEDFERQKSCFVELLRAESGRDPGLFSPTPGAGELLDRLERETGWAAAVATGGWRASASLKLRAAGLERALELPIAFSDDADNREAIMRAAVERAQARNGSEGFASLAYVGDGVWDVRASRAAGFGFLGVGSGGAAERLRAEGAELVAADFADLEATMRLLERAGRG